jgi:hypothetical protein
MPGNAVFGIFFLLSWIMAIGGAVLAVSVVWAVWRMTWAHEKIERHVAEIERLMAARGGGNT